MAVTAGVYPIFLKNQLSGVNVVDWDNDTIKCALFTSTSNAYTARNTAVYISDITNQVAAGGGYTTGGATITGSAPTTSSNVVTADASDASWANSTVTARFAVVYKDTGTTTTSPIMAWVDFGADQSTSNGTFTVQWSASGILQITCS